MAIDGAGGRSSGPRVTPSSPSSNERGQPSRPPPRPSGGLRDPRLAGGGADPGPDRRPYRAGRTARPGLRRADPSPGRPHRRHGRGWAGHRLRGDPGPRSRRAAGRPRAARPGRPSPQGSRPRRAPLPASRSRSRDHLRGAPDTRQPAEQPARPGDHLHRPRGARSRPGAPGDVSAPDAHRSGWHRQDPARPPACGRVVGPLSGRRLLRPSRRGHRPGPHPVGDRRGGAARSWLHPAARVSSSPPSRASRILWSWTTSSRSSRALR